MVSSFLLILLIPFVFLSFVSRRFLLGDFYMNGAVVHLEIGKSIQYQLGHLRFGIEEGKSILYIYLEDVVLAQAYVLSKEILKQSPVIAIALPYIDKSNGSLLR